MVKQPAFDSIHLPEHKSAFAQSTAQTGSLEQAQESIYCFLLDIVKQWHPEAVLQEFRYLFIQDTDSGSSAPIQAVYEIVSNNNQAEFHYTLKRSCYILVNNWLAKRNYQYVQKLIELFTEPIIRHNSLSPTIARLRNWLQIFVNSQDYQELELYVYTKAQEQSRRQKNHTSYLLAAQSIDFKNPVEQREASHNRAQQLKHRFRLDLAIYMARFESATTNENLKNPTAIGDNVLRIIKIVAAKRHAASYAHVAEIFIQQTKKQNYKKFKQNLHNYLFCFGENQAFDDALKLALSKKLAALYQEYDEQTLSEAILLKTCNKIIDSLTTEDRQQPSLLLKTMISQGHPLTVVIMLLKIVLICLPAQTHLESCIADLIRQHEKFPEQCTWMINFIEIFNVMFAIYVKPMPRQSI